MERRQFAGMLSALDEGLANVTEVLKDSATMCVLIELQIYQYTEAQKQFELALYLCLDVHPYSYQALLVLVFMQVRRCPLYRHDRQRRPNN